MMARISYRRGACLVFLAWAVAIGPSSAVGADASRHRLNLVLLVTDQHRGDCVGVDGNRAIVTPNLDRLAREGALFRAAYSSVPSCTPARATLLTGLAPWHHGMLGYGRIARRYEQRPTFPAPAARSLLRPETRP